MQSTFQWSSPETTTCGILISTSLDPDRAMCQSSLFWICSWLLADWSCAIPLIEQPTSRALDGLHLHLFRSCCGRCGARWVAMLHRFPCVVPSVGVRPILVHRSWSVSSHTSRPSAWTNVAAIAQLETHSDPYARRALSVECASPRSLPVQSTLQKTVGVFNEMIAILHHHAPAQQCHRRRRQPSWWTRRVPSAATREKFSNARTSFHRVVRRCQNQFWSDKRT